ncbi:MAG: response regulator transcription factor [Acaryochloris sp. RU_4_1]|nr:response regulator transcription factor [Acaryochloris sp. RU_4_1]NJR53668.1 response regulator transcription factor [Acaryochloris sp. CRU_2_0]
MNQIHVALIEDHDVVRIGLRASLERDDQLQIVGEAASGTQGLRLLETTQPDVAIVDVGLPGIDGIELTRKFRQFQSDQGSDGRRPAFGHCTRILILTMQGSDEIVLAAFAAGADAYCMKSMDMERLAEAVKATQSGSGWIDPAIANIVLRQLREGFPTAQDPSQKTVEISAVEPEFGQVIETYPLTQREQDVLELIVAGCTNSEIAERLYITVGTVKTHVRNVLEKLCAHDRTQAAVRALRAGLIS